MKNIFGISFILCLFIISCKKYPGEGGTALIRGKVFAKNVFNKYMPITADDAEADYDVYILYGENKTPSDRVKTGPDGTFEFRYLRKGNYTIYAYSADTSLLYSTKEITIQKKVEIKSRKVEVLLDTIKIYQHPDKNGTCSIKGRVYARNLNSSFSYVHNSGYMPDIDVYISYSGGGGYDDRVVTDANGYFIFKGLRKGKYKIFSFCKLPVYPTNLEPRTSLTGYIESVVNIECNVNNKELVIEDLKVNI